VFIRTVHYDDRIKDDDYDDDDTAQRVVHVEKIQVVVRRHEGPKLLGRSGRWL
jgi:hypothetical protein